MWIFKHHTCADIIDLDHASGQWRPIAESEKPKGAKALADLPVRGSYTEESGKKFFCYWTDDQKFVFRTFEGAVIEICRENEVGRTELLNPGLHCDISPARYQDGRLRQGFSDVRLVNKQGNVLYELSYNSEYYLQLHRSDFTAASAIQDLSSWDFFIALKEGIDIFTERSLSGRIQLSFNENGEALLEGRRVSGDELLYGESDKICSRTGVWATVNDLRATIFVTEGDHLPQLHGVDVSWVWIRSE